jgi:hypothetical protein
MKGSGTAEHHTMGYKICALLLTMGCCWVAGQERERPRWMYYLATGEDEQQGLSFFFDPPVALWATVTLTAMVSGREVSLTQDIPMSRHASLFPIALGDADPFQVFRIDIAAAGFTSSQQHPRTGRYHYWNED